MALPALATEDTSSEASATTAQDGASKVAELAESVASAGLVAVKDSAEKATVKAAVQAAAKAAMDACDGGIVEKISAGVSAAVQVAKTYQIVTGETPAE